MVHKPFELLLPHRCHVHIFFDVTHKSQPIQNIVAPVHFTSPVFRDGISVTLDKFPYTQSPFKSMLVVRWMEPGRHSLELEVSNAVSTVTKELEFYTDYSVAEAKFQETEPPLANFTTNISLEISQVTVDV